MLGGPVMSLSNVLAAHTRSMGATGRETCVCLAISLIDDWPENMRIMTRMGQVAWCCCVAMPLVEMTLVHYRRLMDAGYGNEDISALFRHKKTLFKD